MGTTDRRNGDVDQGAIGSCNPHDVITDMDNPAGERGADQFDAKLRAIPGEIEDGVAQRTSGSSELGHGDFSVLLQGPGIHPQLPNCALSLFHSSTHRRRVIDCYELQLPSNALGSCKHTRFRQRSLTRTQRTWKSTQRRKGSNRVNVDRQQSTHILPTLTVDFSHIRLFTLNMHTFPSGDQRLPIQGARSASSSITAFMFALAGVAVTSHVVFDHQPPDQPEDVVTYLATLSATVIAGWWLANVLAWAAALRRGIQLDRFTLPGTRRIAQLIVAATLSASCVAETSDAPVMVLVERADAADTSTSLLPSTTVPTIAAAAASPIGGMPIEQRAAELRPADPLDGEPAGDEAAESQPLAGEAGDTEEASDSESSDSEADSSGANTGSRVISSHEVMVDEGDNLWSLASETLTLNGLAAPTCEQIAAYWRLVVAANQVWSGNPDLIVVGETITMPTFELSS